MSVQSTQKRTDKISRIRNRLSVGDNIIQMGNEIRATTKDESDSLMKVAKFTVTIPPEQGLAMKADLCIPWNKLRVMRRY